MSVARECELVNPRHYAAICEYNPEESKLTVTQIPPFKQHHDKSEHILFEEHDDKIDMEEFNEKQSGFQEKIIDLNDALSDDSIDLAITGSAFKYLRDTDISLFTKTILKSNIFARMKPNQKASLIDHLKDKNFTVGMW